MDVDHIGHESAELTGEVDLDGGTPVTSCELQYGKTTNPYPSSIPCTPSSFGSDSTVEAEPTGLETGELYHYRFKATNEKGTNFGVDKHLRPGVCAEGEDPASVTWISEHEATLRGSLDPDGITTEYFFEYGVDTSYGQQTETLSAGSGSGVTNLSAVIENLPSGREFHYRIVASNTSTAPPWATIRCSARRRPQISPVYGATDLTGNGCNAARDASIRSASRRHTGSSTGRVTRYGNSIPIPDESIGSGTEPVPVEQRITGLTPGVTYHFRVVATNEPWGTCVQPRHDLRLRAARLPERPRPAGDRIVLSPGLPCLRAGIARESAGAVQLIPRTGGMGPLQSSQDPLLESGIWPLNNGLASGPPRFMFYGLLGTINGLAAPERC